MDELYVRRDARGGIEPKLDRRDGTASRPCTAPGRRGEGGDRSAISPADIFIYCHTTIILRVKKSAGLEFLRAQGATEPRAASDPDYTSPPISRSPCLSLAPSALETVVPYARGLLP